MQSCSEHFNLKIKKSQNVQKKPQEDSVSKSATVEPGFQRAKGGSIKHIFKTDNKTVLINRIKEIKKFMNSVIRGLDKVISKERSEHQLENKSKEIS